MSAPIVLVTDSNGDVPQDLVERYGIHVVPSILNLDGRQLRDGIDITRREFYDCLPRLKRPPTTATPGAGEFEALYRRLAGCSIIAIHLSSKLSAFFNVSRLGAENAGVPVTLIDSEQISLGLGWQVIAAAEAIAAGATVPEVVAIVTAVRRRIAVYAVLDTLENLRRSGRASHLKALMGELLQVKPLLTVIGGTINVIGQQRTRRRGVAKLTEIIKAEGPLERLAVLHANVSADAQALAQELMPQCAQPLLIQDIATVIGAHLGVGALGAAMVKAA